MLNLIRIMSVGMVLQENWLTIREPLLLKSLHQKISTYSSQDSTVFKDGLGSDLLLWATSKGHRGIVMLLLDAGVDVESRDEKRKNKSLFSS